MRSERTSPVPQDEPRLPLGQVVRRELREHRTAYVVLVALTFVGFALIPMIFPDATLGQRALGGLCLGSWAALSAAPGHFF